MTDGYKNKLGESIVTFSPSRAHNKKAFPSGGSGMVGSADDYITFLEAVRTNKILSKKMTNNIYQNTTGSHVISLAGPGWGWGLISALLVDPTAAKMPMAEKSLGWSGVYGHTWWLDPKNELSVVILTNTSFEGMAGKFPEEIRQVVYKNL
jgi:CubicO group peptidase (beta-lactamase class C family)